MVLRTIVKKMLNKLKLPCIILCVFFVGISCTSNRLAVSSEIANEYYNLAEEYSKLKQYPKAIEFYKKIENIEEYSINVKYKLARAYTLNSEWANAEEMYASLLKLDSENIALKNSLAYIYAKKLDFDAAAKMYDDIISKNPYDATTLKNYILVTIASDNKEKTEELKKIFYEKFPLDDSINKAIEDALTIVNTKKKEKTDSQEASKKINENETPVSVISKEPESSESEPTDKKLESQENQLEEPDTRTSHSDDDAEQD